MSRRRSLGRRAARRRGLPGYLPALLEHIQAADFPPGVHVVEVWHAERCPQLAGGHCNCAVRILSGPAVDRRYGLGPEGGQDGLTA